MAKQRQDSIEQFKKGQRDDLVAKETKELEILKSYLPEELSSSEIKQIIEEVITELGAEDITAMGQVMKETMARAKGRADGKVVSELVKNRLSSKSS